MANRITKAAVISGLITSLAGVLGCSSTVTERNYQLYLEQAPAGTFQTATTEPRLNNFIAMFTELDKDSIEQYIDQTYSATFYFNDTFHSFSRREDLKQYLLNLSEVAETRVWVLDVMVADNDLILRWKMNTKGTVMWRTMDIESVGLTHLRFDDAGKITLQQDYWDGVEGFYAHLPFVGSPIRAIRARVGKGS